MKRQTFNNRLLTETCYQACLRDSDPFVVLAGFVGGATTGELQERFGLMQCHPQLVVECARMFRQRLSASVEHADFLRSLARLPRHQKVTPNVEIERQWLAIADELIERADVAVALWRKSGGEQIWNARNKKAERGEDVSAVTPAPTVIEMHPIFNIEVVQSNDGKPLDVRVVSLPTRETTIEIDRGADGEIVGSRHLERDVA